MHTFKVLSAVVILLALILCAGIYINNHLDNTSRGLESDLDRIETAARNSDWAAAKAELENIKSSWEKSQNTWTMIIDHAEIDNIDNTVIRMAGFIEAENIPLTLGEAASLRQFIKHIPEMESFRLENIL